jgi:hypothetical protein
MNKQKVHKVVVLAFALLGIFVFSNLLHEFTHLILYRDIPKQDVSICALNLDLDEFDWNSGIATYNFKYSNDYKQQVQNIRLSSEPWAKAIQFIFVMAIWIYILKGEQDEKTFIHKTKLHKSRII